MATRHDPRTDRSPVNIMTVCSANLVRSVLAGRLLADRLEQLAPGSFRVSSSGLRALDGLAAPEGVRAITRAYGVDVTDHRSHRTRDIDLAAMDTVLTASSAQRDEIVFRRPALLARAFTVREFARAVSPPITGGGELQVRWQAMVGAAHVGRWRSVPADRDDDDIPDPLGRSGADAYCETERLVVSSLASVLRALDDDAPR
ncbi:arsenate reductase/protein-tyrosine-phosphatase family protein [Curtobacterium pusillum]|uniref:arsenate reductase/protein-tyrosine-phosphatase family protein n=1 Tax=Curtobacterium pusillum TaxID=69373 RepID=UPI0016434A99|nr:hypothetical protein [Curtobacterium pusillum]